MKDKFTVSCIVPVYNAELYLHEFLDSLLNQSFKDFEIICVNDASTDSSLSIILEYQKQKKIVVVENEIRLGAAESRNRGLKIASGEYVIFLDCDDILHPEMIGKMYHCCKINDADLGICYLEYFTGNKKTPVGNMRTNKKLIANYPVIEKPDHFEHIFSVLLNAPYDKMVRRKVLLENNIMFQNLPRTNDLFYSYSAALCSNKIVFIDEVLYNIRCKREGSITVTWSGKNNFHCEAFDAVFDFTSNRGVYQFVQKSFTDRAIKDIYIGLADISDKYRNKTLSELRHTYLEKWGFVERYNENKLTVIQKKMIDNILGDSELDSYDNTLLSCSDERIIKLFSAYRAGDKKVVWWGAGKRGLKFLSYFNKLEQKIDYVVDRDVSKHGKMIAGYVIIGWEHAEMEAGVILTTNCLWMDDIKTIPGNSVEIIDIIWYLEQ